MSVAFNHALHARPDPNLANSYSTTTTRSLSGSTRIGVGQSRLLAKKIYGTRVGSGSDAVQKLRSVGSGRVNVTRKVVVRAGLSLVPEKPLGLYDPAFDKDSCGVGFVAELSGVGNRKTVTDAIEMLVRCHIEVLVDVRLTPVPVSEYLSGCRTSSTERLCISHLCHPSSPCSTTATLLNRRASPYQKVKGGSENST